MKNHEVAELLRNIAQLLEIKEELIFKIRAYEKAALVIENLDEDIEDVWKQGKLDDIPGVGEALTKKISEFLETGRLDYYEELKKQVPVNVEELGKVQGLGPKTIMKLYKELNVKNIKDLEKAAKHKKIENIENTDAECVVAGNPGCLRQIQKGLREKNQNLSIAHPIEILDKALK